MKKWIVKKIKNNLKELKNKKIIVIGIAYKKNIDDCRESPSFEIMSELKKHKANVSYHDPYVKYLPITRKHKLNLSSINIDKKNISSADAVLLLTDHDNINYSLIKKYSKKIFDTRGVYSVGKKIIRV